VLAGPPFRERGRTNAGMVLLAAGSWSIFLLYASCFWLLSAHQTGFQFLPWLSVVSVIIGLAGLRYGLRYILAGRSRLRFGLGCAASAVWGLCFTRAWAQSDGFSKPWGGIASKWGPTPSFPLSADAWNALSLVRTRTPSTARVLSPFALDDFASYPVSGCAGRRAVGEHHLCTRFFPEID